jgi:prolipoprotein diacylglyceryltransferase
LVWLSKKKTRPGVIAGSYLVGYGFIRLSLEQLRPENIIWKIAGIPTASLVSVIAVLAGASLIFWRKRS